MSIADELAQAQANLAETKQYISDAYAALRSNGASLPGKCNASNLAGTINGDFAPPNSLLRLEQALHSNNAKELFPVGTEILDTYGGADSPLIVVQYLDSSNSGVYGGVEGVILIRKYVEPVGYKFGDTANYIDSNIITFLRTDYLENCSTQLKKMLSAIEIPSFDGASTISVFSKWFIMSDTEVYSNFSPYVEGFAWDYWKQKTGFSSPSTNSSPGRILRSRDGEARFVWLRTRSAPYTLTAISQNGGIFNPGSTSSYGVLPACFISKT